MLRRSPDRRRFRRTGGLVFVLVLMVLAMMLKGSCRERPPTVRDASARAVRQRAGGLGADTALPGKATGSGGAEAPLSSPPLPTEGARHRSASTRSSGDRRRPARFRAPPGAAAPPIARAALPPDVNTVIAVDPFIDDTLGRADGAALLYELQLGRLARRVMPMVERDGVVLLPLTKFLELAEIPYDVKHGVIHGRRDRAERFSVDPVGQRVERRGRVSTASSRDLVLISGEAYGSLALLHELWELSATVDRETASVFVYNPEHLPVADRLRRERARAVLLEPVVGPPVRRLGVGGGGDGAVVAYDLHGVSDGVASATFYDIAVATGVGMGTMTTRVRGNDEDSPSVDGAWTARWPAARWLTQARIGDGWLTGPRPEYSRGVALTNAPFIRPVLVEDLPFAGELPPDWSIEAYRAGRLVAFDSVGSSGRYELTLPVRYGENPVTFVAYGPDGDVRTFGRTFRALPSMLPPGVLEYGLSAGACRADRCSARSNLDLQYGVSRRWTVRGGVDRSLYAGIVGAPLNGLAVQLDAWDHRHLRAGIRLDPSPATRIAADYTTAGDGRIGWSLDGRILPSRRGTVAAVEFEARGVRGLTDRTDARLGGALRAGPLLARPYVRLERTGDGTGAARTDGYGGLSATVLPTRALGPILGPMWAQGTMEMDEHRRPVLASVTVARNLARSFRVEGGVRWQRSTPRTTLALSIVSQLAAMRATSLVTASTAETRTRVEQSVGGSLIWSRAAALAMSSESALDRGGVAGRVFLDLDRDGRWTSGEPPLPGVRVLVGNRWCTTDAEGRYEVWGLSPFEDIVISADTGSFSSPWWVPATGAVAVFPAASGYRAVDLPAIVGGVIEGEVLRGDAEEAPSPSRALVLVLTNLSTAERVTFETFSDGSFYRMGVPPGEYALTVDPERGPGVVADTVRFSLPSPSVDKFRPGMTGDELLREAVGATVSGVRLRIRPPATLPEPR